MSPGIGSRLSCALPAIFFRFHPMQRVVPLCFLVATSTICNYCEPSLPALQVDSCQFLPDFIEHCFHLGIDVESNCLSRLTSLDVPAIGWQANSEGVRQLALRENQGQALDASAVKHDWVASQR